MQIPDDTYDAILKMFLSNYETRIMLMIIRKIGNGKSSAVISLDEFVDATKIKPAHVCHSLVKLKERNIVSEMSFGSMTSYGINSSTTWRSNITMKLTQDQVEKYEKNFKEFWNDYPLKMFEADARVLYMNLMADGVLPKELDDAEEGMIRLYVNRAKKTLDQLDETMFPYPTNFLKRDKWRDYLQYRNLKIKSL